MSLARRSRWRKAGEGGGGAPVGAVPGGAVAGVGCAHVVGTDLSHLLVVEETEVEVVGGEGARDDLSSGQLVMGVRVVREVELRLARGVGGCKHGEALDLSDEICVGNVLSVGVDKLACYEPALPGVEVEGSSRDEGGGVPGWSVGASTYDFAGVGMQRETLRFDDVHPDDGGVGDVGHDEGGAHIGAEEMQSDEVDGRDGHTVPARIAEMEAVVGNSGPD